LGSTGKRWVMHPSQRPILNFTPSGKLWPQGEFVPQGLILSPGGEVIPWGWNSMFAPPFF
jgi:hypothetical protein